MNSRSPALRASSPSSQGSAKASWMPTATAIAKLPSAVAISALAQPSHSTRVPSKSRKATNSGASASSSAAAMRTIAKTAQVDTRKMTSAKQRAQLSQRRKAAEQAEATQDVPWGKRGSEAVNPGGAGKVKT